MQKDKNHKELMKLFEIKKIQKNSKQPIISNSITNNQRPNTTKINNKNCPKDKNKTFNEKKQIKSKNEEGIKNKLENLEKIISDINNNMNHNSLLIEQIKQSMNKLKEEKNNKKLEIIDLLSNKESLEEIYYNYIDFLKNKNKGNVIKPKKLTNNSKTNPFDNQDEDAFEILISEIKEMDLNKFIEQTFNFIEEIFENPTQQFKNLLKEKINESYRLFQGSLSTNKFIDTYSVVSNFFLRIVCFYQIRVMENILKLLLICF